MSSASSSVSHGSVRNAFLGRSAETVPASSARFPDGGAWRVEIPSVEGVAALEAVIETAKDLEVPVHRVSQGSGVTMLTDREIEQMVHLCAEERIELCLFARPGSDWDIGAAARMAGARGGQARGTRQLNAVVDEVRRGAALGVTSFLLSDEGALLALHEMRVRGDLPAEVQFKMSVLAAPVNPVAFRVQEMLGADTINVPSDLTVAELSDLRAHGTATIDFYVEAPDDVGGFVRLWEIADIARAAAPVYLKFGLRLAPGIYPAGGHLAGTVVATARERVRRARLGLDVLERAGLELPPSALGEREQPVVDRPRIEAARGDR